MMELEHTNVLRFLDLLKTENNLYIFFEYCNGGDLKQFVRVNAGRINEKVVRVILKQIANGLNYLNEQNVVHRDLKLDNILLHFPGWKGKKQVTEEYLMNFDFENDPFEVIICDLGFAKVIQKEELTNSILGTPIYMAPEILNRKEYGQKVDIWSFGVVMYQLLTGFFPFSGKNLGEIKNRINSGCYVIPKYIDLSLQCFDLLNSCLQFDPDRRINHNEILCHQFLVEKNNIQINSVSMNKENNRLIFRLPKNCREINDENTYMLNIKDSIFFKDIYNKAINKNSSISEKSILEEDKDELQQISTLSINGLFKAVYSSLISDEDQIDINFKDAESYNISSCIDSKIITDHPQLSSTIIVNETTEATKKVIIVNNEHIFKESSKFTEEHNSIRNENLNQTDEEAKLSKLDELILLSSQNCSESEDDFELIGKNKFILDSNNDHIKMEKVLEKFQTELNEIQTRKYSEPVKNQSNLEVIEEEVAQYYDDFEFLFKCKEQSKQ